MHWMNIPIAWISCKDKLCPTVYLCILLFSVYFLFNFFLSLLPVIFCRRKWEELNCSLVLCWIAQFNDQFSLFINLQWFTSHNAYIRNMVTTMTTNPIKTVTSYASWSLPSDFTLRKFICNLNHGKCSMEMTQKERKSKRLQKHNCTYWKVHLSSLGLNLMPFSPPCTLLQKLGYSGFRY